MNRSGDREIRLIGEDGQQLGIMSSREAMKIAREGGTGSGKRIAPSETTGMQNH